jgi:hypothetical protein
MAVIESKLKTGSLKLGTAPGTEFGCQETNVRITPEHNEEGDQQETLCGDVLTAVTTTSWTLNGTAIQDWDATSGQSIVQYSWAHDGETVPFVWKPNAGATSFSGNVTIRALELGGDVNTRITTDFAWPLAGKPTTVWATGTPATGATAGTPGTWTPAGSTPPADVPALIAGTVTASPATAWTTGQYVQTLTAGTAGQAYWNGTAWTAGQASLLSADEEDTEPYDET